MSVTINLDPAPPKKPPKLVCPWRNPHTDPPGYWHVALVAVRWKAEGLAYSGGVMPMKVAADMPQNGGWKFMEPEVICKHPAWAHGQLLAWYDESVGVPPYTHLAVQAANLLGIGEAWKAPALEYHNFVALWRSSVLKKYPGKYA